MLSRASLRVPRWEPAHGGLCLQGVETGPFPSAAEVAPRLMETRGGRWEGTRRGTRDPAQGSAWVWGVQTFPLTRGRGACGGRASLLRASPLAAQGQVTDLPSRLHGT